MRIEVDATSPTGAFQSVCVVHGDKSIRWNTQTYSKLKFNDPAGIFKEVNEFWATLPEATQARVFDAYEKIYSCLTTPEDGEGQVVDSGQQAFKLKQYVAQIYESFHATDAEKIVNQLNLTYPSTMPEDYGSEGNNGRTHTRSDYRRLVQLAVRLRPMLPIFGQYIRTFHDVAGTQYRESSAVALLEHSDVLEMPAVEKLISFMEGALTNFKHRNSTILGGLGTAEMPDWLVAKAVFRRVAPGEVHCMDDVSSIISNVHNFVVKSTLDSVPRSFGGTRKKLRTPEGSKADENVSFLESIRIREEVSSGMKVLVNTYSRSILAIALRVDPSLPHEYVDSCVQVNMRRLAKVVHPVHEIIARWVLSRGCPPSHYDLCQREGNYRYVAAAQALLWHWGYMDIAALMEAEPLQDATAAPMASLWMHDSISRDRLEKLRERYPHPLPLARRDQSPDEANVGVADITELARLIYNEEWLLNEDSRFYSRVNHNEHGYLILPPGFKNILADLLLEVSAGTW